MRRLMPIIGVLRKIYIRVHNLRLADRFFWASIKLVTGSAYTALLGRLNANDVERGAGKSFPVVFTPAGGPTDFAAFVVHMAERCDVRLPPAAAIDLVINAAAGTPVAHYASIARLFHNRVNIHVAWDAEIVGRIIPTLANAASAERLRTDLAPRGDGPIIVSEMMVGRMRARQFHANQAREFLKARSWTAYYCALSLPEEWPTADIRTALSAVAAEYPDWRFVLLGDSAQVRLLPGEAHERLILPCYAGVEFAMQMALAVECDVYFGQCDHFGVAALLSRRTATIFEKSVAVKIQSDLEKKRLRILTDAKPTMIEAELHSLLAHEIEGA